MGWRGRLVNAFDRVGGTRALGRWFGRDRLTVLAYHRVADPHEPGFTGFIGNVSAIPDAFASQMAWVARNGNPVALADVVRALDGDRLPERPVLVTFDDGYLDNLDIASPILRERSIPAVIFLATDHVGTGSGFWWDRVAIALTAAERRPEHLPVIGAVEWGNPHRVARVWIEAAKRIGDDAKRDAIAELEAMLGGTRPQPPATLDWDQVRVMQASGVSFGAHTRTHPVLTSLAPDAAAREIIESLDRVAAETGTEVVSFAYPNGLAGDFDDGHTQVLGAAGVRIAFTLLPGPARWSEVVADPLRVRRVYVHHRDDAGRFAANAVGLGRLAP
jgi:peptidoglycan/xylan/chitin deacetylase (PgdA/CDA1 family)